MSWIDVIGYSSAIIAIVGGIIIAFLFAIFILLTFIKVLLKAW